MCRLSFMGCFQCNILLLRSFAVRRVCVCVCVGGGVVRAEFYCTCDRERDTFIVSYLWDNLLVGRVLVGKPDSTIL